MDFKISTFIFIITAVLLFYILPRSFRKIILLISSILFCFILDPYALAVLLCMTLLTYAAGILLEKLDERSRLLKNNILLIIVTLFVIMLILWKYISGHEFLGQTIVMPIGFSFYTFQAISYLADICSKKTDAEKNPINFAIYMTWFPKLISGPIERAGRFNEELAKIKEVRIFDGSRIISALSYILWGLFMKLVIADRAGIIVDAIFKSPGDYSPLWVLAGSLLYTLQIYCDFAGYTDIMIGISKFFGIELTQNFNNPYFSENITDFWRRWHISLSSFLRDYVYIPLGGNRKGIIRKNINVIIVFLVCGIWHGKGLSFIIWGLLHGIYSVIEGFIRKTKLSFLTKGVVGTVVTFCAVSFAWIFFRAETLKDAVSYIGLMFKTQAAPESYMQVLERLGVSNKQIVILLAATLILFLSDLLCRLKDKLIPEILIATGEIRRDTVFLFLAVCVLILGIYGDKSIGTFIYMNF